MSDTVLLRLDEESFESYYRPYHGISGWVSRQLGPLPADARYLPPHKGVVKYLRGYRMIALGLVIFTLSVIVGLAYAFPWLRVSPYSLVNSGVHHFVSGWLATTLTVLIVMALFYGVNSMTGSIAHVKIGRLLDQLAMNEELWFRTGSENWSSWQRAKSCMLFGGVHVINIIYPLSTLIALTLTGYAFMRVYLWQYRKTGSYELATLHSTKLHATYNRFAFVLMAVSIVVWIFWS